MPRPILEENSMTILTQKRVKELFDYNPDIGVLFRKVTASNNAKAGDEAGWSTSPRDGNIYRAVSIDRKTYYVHRVIWLYMTGEFPDCVIDHINGNGRDNRFKNLRSVTEVENMQNNRKRVDNKSGHTGVSWYKRDEKWEVRIKVGNKYKFIGRFKLKKDAIEARHRACKEYGFHPNHGVK